MTITQGGHGTPSMYERRHCRCDECKQAHRARVARNRKERLESGRLNHGTRSAYDAGCRCSDCKRMRSAYYQAREKGRDTYGGTP